MASCMCEVLTFQQPMLCPVAMSLLSHVVLVVAMPWHPLPGPVVIDIRLRNADNAVLKFDVKM